MNHSDEYYEALSELADIRDEWEVWIAENKARDGIRTLLKIAAKFKECAESAESKLAAARVALAVPEVWSQTERDGMAAAFDKADGKHGHYETLFAVAAWLLRHRQATLATETVAEGK